MITKLFIAAFATLSFAFIASAAEIDFPIEQFKALISQKPTFEKLIFQVKHRRHTDSSIPTNIFRTLELKYGNEKAFILSEDFDKYQLNELPRDFPKEITDTLSSGFHFEPIKLGVKYWARFEDEVWRSFNRSNAITAKIEPGKAIPQISPVNGVKVAMRLAYDVMNLGVTDLAGRGVEWTSSSAFVCLVNESGNRIDGELVVDSLNIPKEIRLSYSAAGKSYPYLVKYHFEATNELRSLKYMPSAFEFLSLTGPDPEIVAEYRVLEVRTSARVILRNEVELSSFIAPGQPRYMASNNAVYFRKVGTNENLPWIRVGSAPQPTRSLVFRGAIFISLSLLALIYGVRKLKSVNKINK